MNPMLAGLSDYSNPKELFRQLCWPTTIAKKAGLVGITIARKIAPAKRGFD
jgi:hypothetical protein